MPPVHRKSAMRVRDGRVVKKNNWKPARGDYYARPQHEIVIERVDPGPGYRHVVTVRQLRDFIALLPDWDELAIGLDAISIWRGNPSWMGMSNPGVVVITAWEKELWWTDTSRAWLDDVDDLIEALGVEVIGEQEPYEVRWTEAQARAFMLLDVFVHELGHHHDRMTSRGDDAPGGEPYAVEYARRVRAEVVPEYLRRFGW